MGNSLNYEKLVNMLDIDNGEIVLVDSREEQTENFGKSREKYNKSREGTRKKAASDFIDKYNTNKSAEPGYNKKLPDLKVNEKVHEEFYEDESNDNQSEKGKDTKYKGGLARKSKKEEEEREEEENDEKEEQEEEEEFDDNSEYANGSRDFENESEKSDKERINDDSSELVEGSEIENE